MNAITTAGELIVRRYQPRASSSRAENLAAKVLEGKLTVQKSRELVRNERAKGKKNPQGSKPTPTVQRSSFFGNACEEPLPFLEASEEVASHVLLAHAVPAARIDLCLRHGGDVETLSQAIFGDPGKRSVEQPKLPQDCTATQALRAAEAG